MPKHELPMKTAAEHDALSGWRRVLNWRPGVRTLIKRGYNKRVRREAKQQFRLCEE